MARPTKNNAEYFSHDADMRNDVKVKALRRNFGHTGYAVWCFILESLTDADFFQISFSDISRELLAADYDVTVVQLTEIVDYCIKIGLLQFSDDNLLYSETHQRRFYGLIQNRERKRLNKAGIKNETQNNGDIMACHNVSETPVNSDNGEPKTHSKVKESKVNQSKGKDIVIYPYRDLVNLWNEICYSLPKVKVISDNRKAKIKTRLNEWGEQEQWLETAKELFAKVQASDFLRGNNRNDWTATFDWLFENGSNWVKVKEGNYDNNRGAQSRTTACTTPQGVTLGVGEFIDAQGRRTYGTGAANIPMNAPVRPSERHAWNAATKQWVIL